MFKLILLILLPMCGVATTWDIEDEETVEISWDENGYIFYCPCMGRFGNQAEYLLGALGFAKGLNRTLVLPPWRSDRMRSEPFDEYFQVGPLRQFHRVILAAQFMRHFAAKKWPPGRRLGWCYHNGPELNRKCAMKEGSPFGPFWDGFGVDFDDYVFHDFGFDEYYYPQWRERYPAEEYPVLALKGAPARLPVEEKFSHLHQYLHWSLDIDNESEHYVKKTFQGEPYIGIHLRNDLDWERACSHLKSGGVTNFMSSVQCYGYGSNKVIPYNVCYPSNTDLVTKLRSVLAETEIKHVFIATDRSPLLSLFKDLIPKVEFHYLDPYRPQIDLAILSRADVFIGNCISSFSAFVTRHRKRLKAPATHYWAVD